MSSGHYTCGSRPGRGGNQQFDDALLARIREPHVAPLNALADQIVEVYRDELGLETGDVPYVDPNQGGIHARALVLLDNPGKKAQARGGSGILSLENPDPTARNLREAYAKFGVDWGDVIAWNVCPVPTLSASGTSKVSERARYAQWTSRFIELCPDLEIVLPLGEAAREGWAKTRGLPPGIYSFAGREVPHCSGQGLNGYPGARDRFESAISELAERLGRRA